MAVETDSVAMVRRAESGGRLRRAIAMATGKSPRPTPWKARPMINTVNPLDTAETTQPTPTEARAARMTARWRDPSASRPITGVATAPPRRVTVRIQCPVLNDTPLARDRVGTRLAPRLPTTDIRDPDNTRVGTKSRRRSEARSSAPLGSDLSTDSTVFNMKVLPRSDDMHVLI